MEAASPNIYLRCPTEPRTTKQLLESPLHTKQLPSSTSKKRQLKRPLPAPTINVTKCANLMGPMSNTLYSEPRRTKELLQSPIHTNVRSASASKYPVTSVSKPTEFVMPHKENGRLPRRKLDFNKDAMKKIEDRILAYVKQITAFNSISQRGIQKMNVNELVRILSHLLAFTGVRLKPLDKENYIEQTIHAMQLLKYPHKINKSFLLVPSASAHHLMLILDFLLDFAPMGNEVFMCDFDFRKNTQITSDTQDELSSAKDIATLQQDLQNTEMELAEQVQLTNSIENQLRLVFEEEAGLQRQLELHQQQLYALSQQSSQLDQGMGCMCIEIWRRNNCKKELQNCLCQQKSGYQAYAHILDVYNNSLRDHCTQLEEHAERTRKRLKNNIEAFNVLMRDLCLPNLQGDDIQSSLELPLSPTLTEIQERQLKLKQLQWN
ncbi:kinetochore and Eb1-associated basic protein [Drosophila montana]|uniref:kinetochore and Eb1-associated basic protein n=1 Tax=Drosophila montana TaxID=40370 RepID=UPI00313CA5C6